MSDAKHWSDTQITQAFNDKGSTFGYQLEIGEGRAVAFKTLESMHGFMNEYKKFMEQPQFDRLEHPTQAEIDDPQAYADRLVRTKNTSLTLFTFSKFSRFSSDYWLGSGMRESFLDPWVNNTTNDAEGALQIRYAYMKDALQWVKDPFGVLKAQHEEATDENVPPDIQLATTEDTLWAAALKDAYINHYMQKYELPDDHRSIYLLHLGPSNAKNLATALTDNPTKTVDQIFAHGAAHNKNNNALMKNEDGSFKTAQEFWDNLPNLGIPSSPIPDNAEWGIGDAQIVELPYIDEPKPEEPNFKGLAELIRNTL